MSRLPNFIYIGPDKAGSSWLHEILIDHPEVYFTPAKDLYFFDRYFDRGPQWYADQFADAQPQHKIVGEVCQDYLFDPPTPARMAEVLGTVQTMVSLRDPVERAWSSWLYARKHGVGPDDFLTALRTEPALLEHGRYASGLDRFLEHFERDSIHIAVFDDLAADPQAFLDATTDFLGIARMPLSEEQVKARLPAAAARSTRIAHLVRRTADWAREHDGARIVGAVKRSPLVHKVLYREIDRAAVRPDADAVDFVRESLADEVDRLERDYGLELKSRWGWV
ncbi:sulfotransferase domain-containing protein [Nocardioides sp.]|uniref:sulfotransferase domain-containing protein n=1 Tax=Nocardioides sp. TaxID=35761 RepID=UPI003D0D597D